MKFYKALLLGLSFLSIGVIASCTKKDNSDDSNKGKDAETIKYEITFNSNGGSNVESQQIESGQKIIKPQNPTKEADDIFVGWFIDQALTEEFDFETEITKSYTLYAKWRKVDAETAMTNFFDRIAEPDYSICNEEYINVVAHSDELVYFDYVRDDLYSDFAVMSIDDDAFQGFYDGNQMTNITYLNEGNAYETARVRLLNSWIDIVGSNIWDCFYNDPDNPLRFTSNDELIKTNCLKYTSYGVEFALTKMKEVVLTLDAEDPTSAIISFDFDDNFQQLEYTELIVTFGNTEGEPIAEAWMSDPNKTLPEAITDWGDLEFYLNSVFLMGQGNEALPFPDFASYAFKLDEQAFMDYEIIYIRDPKASFADVLEYEAKLVVDCGFHPITTEAKPTFRLKLREYKDGTNCYSNIEIDCDSDWTGVTIVAYKYYDSNEYDDLGDINAALTDKGFYALPKSNNFTDYYAADRTYEVVESLLYLFDYDLAINIEISYNDYAEVETYINNYVTRLEQEMNFIPSQVPGSNYHTLSTENYRKSFDYMINTSTNTLSLVFKNELYIPTSTALAKIEEMGFPEIDVTGLDCNSHKVVTNFFTAYYNAKIDYALQFTIDFETIVERDTFLNNYLPILLNSTFEDISGRGRIGKPSVYYDETNGILFGFEAKPQDPRVSFIFAEVSDDYEPSPEDEDDTLNQTSNDIVEEKLLLGNKE